MSKHMGFAAMDPERREEIARRAGELDYARLQLIRRFRHDAPDLDDRQRAFLEATTIPGVLSSTSLVDYRGAPAKDGPRYRAIGNAMAVPVLRWVGERIAAVDAIPDGLTPDTLKD